MSSIPFLPSLGPGVRYPEVPVIQVVTQLCPIRKSSIGKTALHLAGTKPFVVAPLTVTAAVCYKCNFFISVHCFSASVVSDFIKWLLILNCVLTSSFFLEKNMLVFFLRFMRQKAGHIICVQLLQTLNILFDNISNETSVCKLNQK